jgi:hypothetical protein
MPATTAPAPIRLAARAAHALTRAAEWAADRLPHFPDPQARCSAHGASYCLACHRNPSSPRRCGQCYSYDGTGMHGDTCANRIR